MQNKTIKFSPELVALVRSGKKTTTWRLWDDKNLQAGDAVTFLARPGLEAFAEVEITQMYEKKMGEITPDDEANIGHEPYKDNYKAYSEYYGKEVTPDTIVKVLRFKVLKFL